MNAPPNFPPAPVPAKKSNPWPWIIGGCGCLVVLAVLVGIGISFAYFGYRKAQFSAIGNLDETRTEKVEDVPPPHVEVPPTWTTYTNLKTAIAPALRGNFVGFSFSYPADRFTVTPAEDNFIKIEHNLVDDPQHPFTLENFSVSYITGTPGLTAQQDQDLLYPQLLQQVSDQLTASLPNYKQIAQITDHVGGQRGRALLFQAELKGSVKGDVQIYGKAIVVRQPGQERGVSIIMLATSLVPGISSPADVGTKGDLATIFGSFKFTD